MENNFKGMAIGSRPDDAVPTRREILVSLDGSELAEMALPSAVTLAKATLSDIRLLRVVPALTMVEPVGAGFPTSTGLWQVWEKEPAVAREYLAKIAARLRNDGLNAHIEVLNGDPAKTIISYVEDNQAIKAIVMATHGRTGVSRLFLGSVSEEVLHAVTIPLLLVRADGIRVSTEKVLEHSYNTILVPLDGTPFAEEGLRHAEKLAASTGATLVLLAVLPAPEAWERAAAASVPLWVDGPEKEDADRLGLYLQVTADRLLAAGLNVITHEAYGEPATEILRYLERGNIDLVVMATHGRTALQRLWLGSVAMKIMHLSAVPAMLVHAVEHEVGENHSYVRSDGAVLAPM